MNIKINFIDNATGYLKFVVFKFPGDKDPYFGTAEFYKEYDGTPLIEVNSIKIPKLESFNKLEYAETLEKKMKKWKYY